MIQRNFFSALVAALFLSACAPTVQITEMQHSGFLGDYYDLLQPGEGQYQASFRYVGEEVDLARYRKIILDPVLLYGDNVYDISASDRQVLANNFFIAMREALSHDHEIVDFPEPDTARIQIAIVKATKKNVVLDTISTILPVGLAASSLQQYTTGRPSFTGSFAIETMVTDAFNDQLLGVGIDERVGGKRLSSDQFDAWSDINSVITLYAQIIRFRVCELRGDVDCVEPTN